MATNVNADSTSDITKLEAERTGSGTTQLGGGWTKHAPHGGITINDKQFKGGQFIPNEDLENASPAELQSLANASRMSAMQKAVKGGRSATAQASAGAPQQTAAQPQTIPLTENVYIVDTGGLLGSENNYGTFIIRNNVGEELVIRRADAILCRSFSTQRLDIILRTFVVSVTGDWRTIETSNVADTENLANDIATHMSVQKIPLQQYDVFKKLSPPVLRLFIQPQQQTQ